MTVWVVTEGDYDDYHICGIFSCREKAIEYMKKYVKHNSSGGTGYGVTNLQVYEEILDDENFEGV